MGCTKCTCEKKGRGMQGTEKAKRRPKKRSGARVSLLIALWPTGAGGGSREGEQKVLRGVW